MANLIKILSCTFLLIMIYTTTYGQNDPLNSYTQKIIVDKDNSIYFNNNTDIITSNIRKMLDSPNTTESDSSMPVLCGHSTFYKKGEERRNCVNFQVFNDKVFTIIANDSQAKYFPRAEIKGIPEQKRYHQYYLECNTNTRGYMAKGAAYHPYNYRLELDNYGEIANLKFENINYDFIIVEEDIYLLLSLNTNLYLYKMISPNELPKVKWELQNCISDAFDNEYFIVTPNNNQYIIHTETQGEYELGYFLSNPQISRINNENINERIFVEDKRTNATYVLTKEEGRSLIESGNHISTLNLILANKKN